jgi:hypothetical protein
MRVIWQVFSIQTGPIKKNKENITEITCTAQENGRRHDDKKKNLRAFFASPCHDMDQLTLTKVLD